VPESETPRKIDLKTGQLLGVTRLKPGEVAGVVHYEELVVNQVDNFLKNPPDATLPRLEMLQHAEKVLAEALRFHETAREREQRTGPRWDEVGRSLRDVLRRVGLSQLKEHVEVRNTAAVAELSRHLALVYPQNGEVRSAVTRAQVELGK